MRCCILGTGSHYLAKIYRESYIQKRWVKCFYCSFSDNAPSRKWVTTMHCWCVSIRLATVYVSVIVYWLDVEKIIDDNHEQNWEFHGDRHPHLYSFYWGRGKRKGEELYSLKKIIFYLFTWTPHQKYNKSIKMNSIVLMIDFVLPEIWSVWSVWIQNPKMPKVIITAIMFTIVRVLGWTASEKRPLTSNQLLW